MISYDFISSLYMIAKKEWTALPYKATDGNMF